MIKQKQYLVLFELPFLLDLRWLLATGLALCITYYYYALFCIYSWIAAATDRLSHLLNNS